MKPIHLGELVPANLYFRKKNTSVQLT